MSRFMYAAAMYLLLIIIALIAAGYAFNASISSRPTGGETSDHFDGTHFFNPHAKPAAEERRKSVWVWMLSRSRGAWKRVAVTTERPPERVSKGLRVTFINHATVLLQFSGLNIITDPVWAYRVSPLPFIGPARYADPGVRFEDLPPIDIVLLSHNHYDHMDLHALRRISKKWNPRIYTGLGNAEYLARKGVTNVHAFDWWQGTEDAGITITAVPAQHFAARSFSDRNFTLWCGFVLETPQGRIYFSGDTGFGPFVEQIAERFGSFAFSLIPIGAYDPAWMMQLVHANPEEAIRMHDILKSSVSLGIHHGTFRLTDEAQEEPARRLEAARGSRDFRALPNGGSFTL